MNAPIRGAQSGAQPQTQSGAQREEPSAYITIRVPKRWLTELDAISRTTRLNRARILTRVFELGLAWVRQ